MYETFTVTSQFKQFKEALETFKQLLVVFEVQGKKLEVLVLLGSL